MVIKYKTLIFPVTLSKKNEEDCIQQIEMKEFLNINMLSNK